MRFHPAIATAALAAAALVALSGCSSSGDSAPKETSDVSQAAAKWGDCMRGKGFQIDDPTAAEFTSGALQSPANVDAGRFTEASGACGGKTTASDDQKDIWRKQTQGFVACMADNDVTGFDQAKADEGVLDFEGVDETTPTYAKAYKICSAKELQGWGGL